jgi:hypothetical protein
MANGTTQQVINIIGKTVIAGSALAAVIAVVKGAAPPQNTGPLQFPKDLDISYSFNLNFYQYSRSTLLSVGTPSPLGSLTLPIPNNLGDTYSVAYGEESLGTALGGGANALAGIGATGDLFGGIGEALGAMGTGGVANALGGAAGGLLSAFAGVAANPFMTVLFKNPNYKTYEFSWRLFARSNVEAAELAKIITSIRYHMLPDADPSSGGAVLSYPSLVKCRINAASQELYPFKYAVIKDATFNYAPDGAPSFHKDGRPTAVDVKISLQEVEYFLKSSMNSSASSI